MSSSTRVVFGVVCRVAAGKIESVGVTCALCHSTVDNSLTTGVGKRLDGWPNRDLNVGTIVGLSPVIPDDAFSSWGPGRYDPRDHAFNGKSLIQLNSPTVPVVIPPAYGLQGVALETVTGDGPISYWNNYVAVTQMGGHGSFECIGPGRAILRVQVQNWGLERVGPGGWSLSVALDSRAPLDSTRLTVLAVAAAGRATPIWEGSADGAILSTARFDRQTMHAANAAAAQENAALRARIAAMEASRFWKLRNRWFALKRALRLTSER